MVKYLLEKRANSEAMTRSGATPLHYCARWGGEQVLRTILNQGVDVSRVDALGRTALHHAVFSLIEMTDVLMIIEKGCDLNIADQNGMTALHLCCKTGNLQLAKILLWNGALAKV